jgi:hypothetical protein
MQSFSRSFLYFALALFASAPALAQSGFVKSGGQPIPGATITITQGAQTLSTVTDAGGHYTFPPLAAGTWSAVVEMFGFDALKKDVNYDVANAPVNFELQLKQSPLMQRMQRAGGNAPGGGPPAPGGAGNRPGRPGANTANANPNQQVDQEIQNELNAQQNLAGGTPAGDTTNESFLVSGSLSPGMSQGAQADSGPDMRFGNPGGAADANNPNAGSPFGQQGGAANGGGFGGGGGGFGGGGFGGPGGRGGGGGGFGGPGGRNGRPPGQVAGNQFGNRRRRNQQIRGEVSYTLQNSFLNAKPFSLDGLVIPQAAYAQNRFSLIVGGPLVLGKLVKDPSTQFFLTYFATRSRTPILYTETVPTAAERSGDFSQATQSLGTSATSVPVVLYSPTTHQPLPGNIIPASSLNASALALLSYYPLPNQPGAANNYQLETAQPNNTDNVGFRIQRNVTKKDRLSTNIQFQRRDNQTVQPFGYRDDGSGYGLSTQLGWTRNISTTLLSTLTFRFSRNRNQVTPYFSSLSDVASTLNIPGTSSNPINNGPPTLNFTNFASLSDSAPALRRNQSQGFTEALSLLHGVHNISIGGGYTRADQGILSDPNGRGTFNFTGVSTSAVSATGQTVTGTGYDLADFLYGLPQSSSIQYNDKTDYYIQNQTNAYVQDEWKVRSNFTAILGLRYEYFSPLSEKYGRLANLDIAPGYAAVAVVTAGGTGPYTGSFPTGLINPDYNNFSPRVALAWKVSQFKKSTVVRGGYGIYYNGQSYLQFGTQLANQPPFATSNSINTSSADVLTINKGFLTASPTAITNTFAVGRNYRTPYAGTWNLTIQRDLGGGFFTEIGYLGTKGTRLDVRTLPNEAPPGSAIAAAQKTQLGNAVGFTFDQSIGNSIFNAFQYRLNRRFNRGISFQLFYQFAKSIDDSSTFGGAGNTVAQNWLDISAERGLSSFDVRHQLTTSFNWTSPVAGPGNHIAADSKTGRLLKDWQFTGAITAQTGNPLTARVLGNGQQLAQTGGTGSGRAEATGESISGGEFFNLGAFTIPATGTYGDAGRNTIPGPGLFNLNVNVARSFNLSERRRIEFRVESNNILNHVNYTNLYTVVNAVNYGLPSSAAGMRTVQAVVRLRF